MIGEENLRKILSQALVPSSYQGVVGAGSDATHVVDAVGIFAPNQWTPGFGVQFTQDTPTAALRGVWQQITGNDATTLTVVAPLPAVPAAGDKYNIRAFGQTVLNLQSWGGQAVKSAGAAASIAETDALAGVHDPTTGTTEDAPATDSISAWSIVALLKGLWAKLAGIIKVSQVGSTLLSGGILGCTNVATVLGAPQACSMILLQADQGNASDLLIGDVNAQTIRLTPGQSMTVPVDNVNQIYAKTAAGVGNLNWLPVA